MSFDITYLTFLWIYYTWWAKVNLYYEILLHFKKIYKYISAKYSSQIHTVLPRFYPTQT